ncbi:hypothetical protein NP493_126g01003 [Ridgeia piscesae]|uniref:Calx-beta domain-containing protein n=1 Tax=Ridgeia piscesae TaxID=27915 RepID=A0AAD9UGM9_RIDPI|nr:hypothetical protein NP493_126g01003 [Ridgeia piscesae]
MATTRNGVMAPGSWGRGRCALHVALLIVVCSVGMVDAGDNTTVTDKKSCGATRGCVPGVVVPMWEPHTNLSVGDKVARAIVYFAAMAFLFLGVSIIADRFMAAIEVITSKEKEVTVRRADGETTVVCVRIWNETVSNLTLMALGSSAPEIMLSIIEIIGNGFEAGDLGPSTIVGSAAFNLFVIIGICVFCIPNDEIRRIKHLRVFFITATWSVFAYLWMYLIIAVFSRGIIEVWEGVLTFLFFPATVVTAYIADRKIFIYKFLRKRYRASRSKTVIVTEGGVEMDNKANHVDEVTFKGLDSEDSEVREFERHRKDFIEILRELRRKNPNVDMKSLEEMAEMEAMNRGPKSRAFYRIQATRKLTGGGNVIKKSKLERKSSLADVAVEDAEDTSITRIFFEPGHYTVMENVGTFDATVSRRGGDENLTVYVDYATEDGSANAGTDYEHSTGTLVFTPGEMHKQIPVTIIDDDVFEEDEHFYIRLSNIRIGGPDGMFTSDANTSAIAQLDNPSMATVMILDDDHCGVFHFGKREETVSESVGEAAIKVCRASGARGLVKIRYHTLDGTAKGLNKDFEHSSGDLVFENNQTE